MPLTDTKCRSLNAQEKQYKKSDGGGLYLLITPNSNKYWRMNYRHNGKSKTLAIGVYPEISLKEARLKRDEARQLLNSGKDPSLEKQKAHALQLTDNSNAFKRIGVEWLLMQKENVSINHFKRSESLLVKDIFPKVGLFPIKEISAAQLLEVIRKIEDRGALNMAQKAYQCCSQIFRYAVATGRAERDITQELKGALKTRKVRHHAYLKEDELAEFFAHLSAYDGRNPIIPIALDFMILNFTRTNELRLSRWDEFDLVNSRWRIPAERMKNGNPHIVPLSTQSIRLLQQAKNIGAGSQYVFFDIYKQTKPISENAMLGAMYRMGYHSRATVHGFRATASTILNEHGFRPDVIERQLAHVEGNQVRAAYNHAEYLSERTEMMQWWADHLDTFRLRPESIRLTEQTTD